MDPTVPRGAALLLDFIGDIEAPRGYQTIYGNNQGKLKKPITSMTLDEVIAIQPSFHRAYGSSATGRYQFMRATLQDLKRELGLRGSQVLDPNLQDRLAYHLLKRRGYQQFKEGKISRTEFGKRLAMEWASLPVLAGTKGAHRQITRGQSYYAGDRLNKSLTTPEAFEQLLDIVARTSEALHDGPIVAPPHETIPLPEDIHNANQEPWWQSRVTWGAIIAGIVPVLASVGVATDWLDQDTLAMGLAAGGSAVGAVITLYGRWKAKKPLGAGS